MTVADLGRERRRRLTSSDDLGEIVPSSSGDWRRYGDRLWLVRKDEPSAVAELPVTVDRIITRDAHGMVAEVHYLCRFASGDEVLATFDEIRSGAAWTRALGLTPGDPKICQTLATAVAQLADEGEQIERAPRLEGDRLIVPPAPYGPPGYGELPAQRSAELADVWTEILVLGALNPNFALTLGAAAAGLYVAPLGLVESPWLHLVGDSSVGKTTVLRAAAAMFGDPAETMLSFNTTAIGLAGRLAEISVMPAFVDELGAASLTPSALESLGYRMAAGGSRLVGTRDGGTRQGRSFRSTLITTGNRSLARITESPGLPARIVEISSAPLLDVAYARRLRELTPLAFGIPLTWLARLELERFDAWRTDVRGALGAHGGVGGRIADSLALFVTGAGILGELGDVAELVDAAMTAAAAVLEEALREAEESGRNAGEQLMAAIVSARAQRPYAFPAVENWGRDVRELEGLMINDGRVLSVFAPALRRIAGDAGIDDPAPGLRILRESGDLLTQSPGRLTTRRRLGWGVTPMYDFRLTIPGDRGHEGNGFDSGPQSPVHFGARARAPEAPARALPRAPGRENAIPGPAPRAPRAPRAPVFDQVRDGENCYDPRIEGVTASELEYLARLAREREDAERERSAAALRRPTIGAYRDTRAHTAGMSSRARSGRSGVLTTTDEGRIALVGAEGPLVDDLRIAREEVGELLEAADRAGVELVVVDGRAAAVLALGDEAPGWDSRRAPAGGWYAWRKFTDELGLERERTVRVVIGAGEFGGEGVELAGELERFERAHGLTWQGSGGGTFAAMLRRSHSGPNAQRLADLGDSIEPRLVLEGYGTEGTELVWDREPTELERTYRYAHLYDRNGAFLSVLGQVPWAVGRPAHLTHLFDFDREERRPGWWHAIPPTAEEFSFGVPYLFGGRGGGRRGLPGLWMTTASATFVTKDLGLELEIDDAWVWDDHIAYTRTVQEHLRDARAALGELAGGAYAAHKAVYAEGVNWWRANFHRSRLTELGDGLVSGPPQWRPNAQAHVAALAKANLARAVRRAGLESGVWPVASGVMDGAIYLSADPDPERFAAEIGLELGTALGRWKVDGSIELDEAPARRVPGELRSGLLRRLDT